MCHKIMAYQIGCLICRIENIYDFLTFLKNYFNWSTVSTALRYLLLLLKTKQKTFEMTMCRSADVTDTELP